MQNSYKKCNNLFTIKRQVKEVALVFVDRRERQKERERESEREKACKIEKVILRDIE